MQYLFINNFLNKYPIFFHGTTDPSGPESPHCRGFTIAVRRNTLRRTPLEEWSGRRRDLFPKTYKTHKRKTPIHRAGFEPAIPESERPKIKSPNRPI